jgi:serine/threonine protein kinase
MSFTLRQLTGESIGQYDLKELYGTGGMGAVYRAHQRNLERDVAFKVMSLAYAMQSEFVERFYREAKLAASLEHPHIVPIYDYGAMEEWQYVVMRLLTGGSLAERIDQMKGQPPSIEETSSLLTQLAGALDYAHSRNIVHRDIKSNNIMFDSHGTAYVVDFGIAKLIQDTSTRLTADGMTVGTPTHMAPELWTGDDASAASDQYALGIVVYELLTGRVPFNATSPFALMNRHVQETPESVQKYAPHLHGEFDSVLWRALAKDKDERYPSVGAFARDFASVAKSIPPTFTGIFTMDLRRELLGTDFAAKARPMSTDGPQFSGMNTITPPSMPAPPPVKKMPSPPTSPAAVNAPAPVGANGQRPPIKSLSALQRAQAEAAVPAAPKNPPIVSPLPFVDAPAPKVARPKQTAAVPPSPAEPAKERVILIERKDIKASDKKEADGCMTVLVDSVSNLFGLTLSSTARASIALVLSGIFTVLLILGAGALIAAFVTSPQARVFFGQIRASLESIGSQASQPPNGNQTGIQPNFGSPPPTPLPGAPLPGGPGGQPLPGGPGMGPRR